MPRGVLPEAGLPGLPVYRPLTDVLTFTIATTLGVALEQSLP